MKKLSELNYLEAISGDGLPMEELIRLSVRLLSAAHPVSMRALQEVSPKSRAQLFASLAERGARAMFSQQWQTEGNPISAPSRNHVIGGVDSSQSETERANNFSWMGEDDLAEFICKSHV